ncbi:hypothetical protein I7I53_03444 [Histoplasma capsulatum var. duboisii H88]|uniref:Uncharacterized protein n=1 Tax=Ajellomyces capsulatus (strain H88) TaxID=544711 RepID=A0A8A1LNL2_AJEC8|nr:hypothetical protein I7I53_03444 [Histoplasma capsulatum var. duboisii H88]
MELRILFEYIVNPSLSFAPSSPLPPPPAKKTGVLPFYFVSLSPVSPLRFIFVFFHFSSFLSSFSRLFALILFLLSSLPLLL